MGPASKRRQSGRRQSVIPTASADGGRAEESAAGPLLGWIPRRFASRNDGLLTQMAFTLPGGDRLRGPLDADLRNGVADFV